MAHTNLISLFSDIADAIRDKTGSNGLIKADDFPTAISEIPTGGGGDIVSGVFTLADYVESDRCQIVSIDDIGFTPTLFLVMKKNLSDLDYGVGTRYIPFIGVLSYREDSRGYAVIVEGQYSSSYTSRAYIRIKSSAVLNYVDIVDGYVSIGCTSNRVMVPDDYMWFAFE